MVCFAASIATILVFAQKFPFLAVTWLVVVALIGVGLTIAGWAIDPSLLLLIALIVTIATVAVWIYVKGRKSRYLG